MYIFWGLLGLLGAVIFLVLIFVSLFTKKKMKRNILAFFACSILFFVCVAITPKADKTENVEQKSNKITEQNLPEESEESEEKSSVPDKSNNLDDLGELVTLSPIEDEQEKIDRELVLKVDSIIWERILSAEKNYNTLLETMSSTDSLYSIYKFCEDLEDLMVSYMSDIGKISDDLAKEYVECAGIYMSQIDSIAGHIKKYANKNDMKELSKAEEGMENLPTFTEAVVIARFSYLSACGFSEQEIIEIGNAG